MTKQTRKSNTEREAAKKLAWDETLGGPHPDPEVNAVRIIPDLFDRGFDAGYLARQSEIDGLRGEVERRDAAFRFILEASSPDYVTAKKYEEAMKMIWDKAALFCDEAEKETKTNDRA